LPTESPKSIKKESAVMEGRSRRPEIATHFIVVARRTSLTLEPDAGESRTDLEGTLVRNPG
jgi:hypothetical protein